MANQFYNLKRIHDLQKEGLINETLRSVRSAKGEVDAFAKKLPLLGICGGMQMLAGKCGAKLLRKVINCLLCSSKCFFKSATVASYLCTERIISHSVRLLSSVVSEARSPDRSVLPRTSLPSLPPL